MKIYIAGKMSGLSMAEIYINFLEAEIRLKDEGHEVFNPCRRKNVGKTYEECMQDCFELIDEADAVFMLSNSRDSFGAMRELNYAIQNGKKYFGVKIMFSLYGDRYRTRKANNPEYVAESAEKIKRNNKMNKERIEKTIEELKKRAKNGK